MEDAVDALVVVPVFVKIRVTYRAKMDVKKDVKLHVIQLVVHALDAQEIVILHAAERVILHALMVVEMSVRVHVK